MTQRTGIELPSIPGLADRAFAGADDFVHIADLVNADARALGDAGVVTAEQVAVSLENNPNLDLTTGLRLVEVDGSPIAYVIVRWLQEHDGPLVLRHLCKLRPQWRGKGIGSFMLGWAHARLTEIAADHNFEPKVFRTNADLREPETVALLEAHGYQAIEYDALLVRPDLEDVPEADLPDGVEIRPVEEGDLRTIYDADIEAFRDHWGFVEPTEGDWVQFIEFPYRDESMWKVAWAGDRVVGQVRSFINEAENEEMGRLRGWAEFISTVREWRGRGIATALICESLRELKQRGMTEAALGVHVGNPHGAYRLYQGLGFQMESQGATYERRFEA